MEFHALRSVRTHVCMDVFRGETHREETQNTLSNTCAESSAGLRIVTNRSELVTLQLPPTSRFDDAVRHDGTEGLRKSIVFGRS